MHCLLMLIDAASDFVLYSLRAMVLCFYMLYVVFLHVVCSLY